MATSARRETSVNSLPVSQPENHGPAQRYIQLVNELFVPLEQLKRNKTLQLSLKKPDIVERYIRNYRQSVGNDILSVAKLYLPKYDRERIYMIKEYRLGRLVSDYLNLTKESEDSKRIRNWKRLSLNKVQSAIQFADLLTDTISKRRIHRKISDDDALSVDDVNEILDNLTRSAEDYSVKGEQSQIMRSAIDRMSDNELRYFFRIVLKRDPVNSETLFLRCWHPDARRLFDITHDFKTVFWGLSDPSVRLSNSEMQVHLMLPFTPQRAEKVANNYDQIVIGNFHEKPFYIEEKFDGERIQVHVQKVEGGGYKFKYFTRNAMDYTSIYGERSDVNAGCISPFLKPGTFRDSLENCILDGEMICWDPILNLPLPYSVVKSSALKALAEKPSKESYSRNPHPMFVAFDCLLVNNKTLERSPLSLRKEVLTRALSNEVPNLFVAAQYKESRAAAEIEKAMSAAIAIDSEGIMLKDPESKYVIGSTSKRWIKVKPEYLEEFGENLDLVVVGKIPATKTSFLCALRDDGGRKDEGDEATVEDEDAVPAVTEADCKFIVLCKISNGFSIEDYKYIDKVTAGKWKETSLYSPDPDLVKFGKRVPVAWIDPHDSVVVEVRARSITRQPAQDEYATDTTLYNAYCVSVRYDKDWKTADTLSKYEAESNRGKLRSAQNVFQKSKKVRQLTRKEIMIQKLNAGYEESSDHQNDLFGNYVFSILTDCVYLGAVAPIRHLGHVVKEYGGALARNPNSVVLEDDDAKLIVIAEKMTSEVLEINGKYNVFKFKWVEDCIAAGELVAPDSSHIFSAETSLKLKAEARIDRFGTNPVIPLTRDTLWNVTHESDQPSAEPLALLPPEEIRSLQEPFLFHDMSFLVVAPSARQVEILATKISMNGGSVTSQLAEASYVVAVGSPNREVQGELLDQLRALAAARTTLKGRIPRIVSSNFVDTCIEENSVVEPAQFKVPM